jgi:flavin reductase (DIM6/NTAB) family NADH-FMN oxidoreductase RutF
MVAGMHAPRLEGCLASIECETWKIDEVGDHWMVLGQVVQLHTGVQPHQPLLFYSGRYRHLQPGDSTPAPDLSDVRDDPAHIYYD